MTDDLYYDAIDLLKSLISHPSISRVVDAEGNKKMISDKVGFCPVLSPDGKKVAYNEVDDVVVMNIDGTGKKVIGVGFNPSWVNNNQIVFEKTTDDGHTYLSGELYLANIANNILTLGAFAYYHTFVNGNTRPDKQSAAALGVEQAVSRALARFVNNNRACVALLYITLVFFITVKNVIHNSVTVGIGHKL